jgi:phage gp36-like protein
MAYITDLELGQLSAIPAALLAQMDPAAKAQQREAGTSKINGYLAARYGDKLPITTPPLEIKQVNADLTAYWLMTQHGYAPQGSDEEFRNRFDDAIEWLKDVSRGTVTLDLGVVTAPKPYRVARATSRCPRGW